ncbi:MAG: IS3 family transposase [Prolixibacteraceae bacterium]|nr:IS3 family transposase [Prolixibacteraceae bacterium]
MVVKVSESGYYRWLKNRKRQTHRQLLLVKIKELLAEHPDNNNYGVKRIQRGLIQKGINVSICKVYRAMRENGLIHKRRTPHTITKATTEIQEKDNIIKRDFKAEKPLTKLLTDITQVQCSDGKLYVSAVLDCYNGEIIC